MRLAFCIFSYFPYGGLERNFKSVADECAARGHEVDVYTMQWDGSLPESLNLNILPVRGWSNHRRAENYVRKLQAGLQEKPGRLVIGFNKMPGLDLYYAGDTCYLDRIRRERGPLSRLTPRYRILAGFEEAVFSPESKTEIIYLSEKEKNIYQEIYHTPEARFHYVPPGVNKDLIRSRPKRGKKGGARSELGLAENDNLLLMIGSNFRTKGVHRSIRALASLPSSLLKKTSLVIIGRGNERKYKRIARRLQVHDRVIFLGGRDDVPAFLADADLVLQPSLNENTGNPIVEAITAGVPVLATENCGFSGHIRTSGAGRVIPCNPFNQETMNHLLRDVLLDPERARWHQLALSYSDRVDLYSRIPTIVGTIEEIGRAGT